jgi:hypothetical protein
VASFPITITVVSVNPAHGVLDATLRDTVCQWILKINDLCKIFIVNRDVHKDLGLGFWCLAPHTTISWRSEVLMEEYTKKITDISLFTDTLYQFITRTTSDFPRISNGLPYRKSRPPQWWNYILFVYFDCSNINYSKLYEENHRHVVIHWHTVSRNVASSTPWTGFTLTTVMVIGMMPHTGSCKSKYHTICQNMW